MILSRFDKNVFWAPYGATGPEGKKILLEGWYHWDEIGSHCYGPYQTEKLAISQLQSYIKSLDRTPDV